MYRVPVRAFAVILAVLIAGYSSAADLSTPDFNRDVRPILAAHCFKCHGPDDGQRQAGLRLDARESAIKLTDSGLYAIVPGKPDESELVRRIESEDPAEFMPPPQANKPLAKEKKAVLRQWVTTGATYAPHWAFVPPVQASPPVVKDTNWPRNEIDHFVLARLEAEGLRPSPPADRLTLVRRVYLDLIGLPPTPEEADAFVNDPACDAYGRLVDRLLASPHYGERWARKWLDLARYADTNGFVRDGTRSIWPYRDWVINAFNADMPFDQFTIEQIAGDMLPSATLEQRIATGFHRNTRLNEEGGNDPLEAHFNTMVDRVNTTATTWLGLTLGCAQCHTHKYDPIPQRDYYKFMALLNNAEEPQIEVPQPEITGRRAAIENEIAEIERNFPNEFPLPTEAIATTQTEQFDSEQAAHLRREYLEQKFDAWRSEAATHAVRWSILRPTHVTSNLPILTVQDDDSVLVSGDQSKSDTYELEYSTDQSQITALRLEVMPDERLPGHGPGLAYYALEPGNFFLSELTLLADNEPVLLTNAQQTYVPDPKPMASAKSPEGNASAAIDGNRQTGWTIDGQQGKANAAVFQMDKPLKDSQCLKIKMLFETSEAADLGRFRISVTSDPPPSAIGSWPSDIEALLTIPEQSLTSCQRSQLLRYYLSIAPELVKQHQKIADLRKQMPAVPTTLVMVERPAENTRPTYLHHRGDFLQPTDRVEPDVLSILPPLPSDAPHNRLALARWLIDPGNPLVARVTVNRVWASFFGRGLVSTPDDFGYQGEPPTHPQLLDWLAVEFIKRHWSLKQIDRLIVTSATYQQSSCISDKLFAIDPQNKLLARGPRQQLEAELIRDAALCESGLLSPKIGGPSVFPPQPPGVKTVGLLYPMEWKVSEGDDRYRRGLYTFSKRTDPYPMFNAFDSPSGETCIARREVSNSPLQSLALLNDPVFVEAAQALGRRTAERAGTTDEKIVSLFRDCLTRFPSESERNSLLAFYNTQSQRLNRHELDAAKISGIKDSDATVPAAWTLVAEALLNLDEAISKE